MRQIIVAFIGVFMMCASYAVTCSDNQYVSNGECVNCIYNAMCDGATYRCNDGFYDTSANECAACPPNSTCTSPTEFSCVAETFLHNGVCTACPENATCAGSNAGFHCNPGFYRHRQFCRSCDGHVCNGETLVSCGAGYLYYEDGSDDIYCYECDNTKHCPAGSTKASMTCIEGYYKNALYCLQCPAEYYCPDGTATVGNYKQYCAPGYYQNGGECVACPDGVVCPGHKAHTCPDGLFWHDNGQCLSYAQGDPGVPGACNPGYYDSGTECIACPVENSTCRSATDFDCVAGFYKNGNKCDVCPANSTCPAASTQISCTPGYWLNGAICTKCSGVNYCTNNTMYPCPVFAPASLDAVLPAGHEFISVGRVNVWTKSGLITQAKNCYVAGITIEAPEGFYFKVNPFWNGEQYWGNRNYWTYTETPGRYLASAESVYGNRYYKKNNACTNAPENAIYTGAGSPDGNDCPWRCGDGYFRDGDVCTACPAGLVCRDGMIVCPIGQYASGAACLDCPAHYIDRAPDNTAPQSINECQIKCDAGMYLSVANGTECANVGAGFWNAENYTNYGSVGARNACPDKLTTIGYGAGADSADDCGKILHIGNYTLRLRSGKLTKPSLAVQVGDRVLYGDMATEKRGHLRVQYNGATYSVFNSDID